MWKKIISTLTWLVFKTTEWHKTHNFDIYVFNVGESLGQQGDQASQS